MTKTTKFLLAVSLISFAISITGALWGLFLPAGAISFGLFMISKVMEKEVALFDAEQRLKPSLSEKNAFASQRSQQTHPKASSSPAPAR